MTTSDDDDATMIIDEEDESMPNDLLLFPMNSSDVPKFDDSQLIQFPSAEQTGHIRRLAQDLGLILDDQPDYSETTNGAKCLGGTGSDLLNLFANGGALRGRPKVVMSMFLRAIIESSSHAMRCLFYLRDIRGGQGERKLFRGCMRMIANSGVPFLTMLARRNMRFIPEYGRFDDVIHIFEGTPLQSEAMRMVRHQLERDTRSETPSLLAKWMPSENTSSRATKRLASVVMSELEYPPRKYRKTLSSLRKKLSVIECRLSNREFDSINFEKVPSCAFKKYTNTFRRHDSKRFKEFLDDVESGDKKVNSATLYPYDLVNPILMGGPVNYEEARALDAQWKALPEFIPEGEHAIVIVDTSGSMSSGMSSVAPICVAVSLGLYIGERMPHKGFITFSDTPQFIPISGETLQEKCENMSQAHWHTNTNLQRVFDLILNMSLMHRLDKDSMIKRLIIISDMQFDTAVGDSTNFEEIDRKYASMGLNRPSICYWNVNASSASTEVAKDQSGALLVSGCSPSILKFVLARTPMDTPMMLMMNVLTSQRYCRIH